MYLEHLSVPVSALLAGVNVGIITDIVLALILALFAFINLKRGFSKQILNIVVTVGSLLVAFLFSDDILMFVDKHFALTEKLANALLGAAGENAALNAEVSIEGLNGAIASMGLPQFIAGFAEKALATATGSYATIGQFLTQVVSHYILIAVFFIVIWILARIILSFVKKLLAKVFNLPGLKLLDKILGFVLGIVKAIILMYVLIYIIDILPSTIGHIDVVKNGLSDSIIGGLLKQYNLVSIAFTWMAEKFHF